MALAEIKGIGGGEAELKQVPLTALIHQYGRNQSSVTEKIKIGKGKAIYLVASTPALTSEDNTQLIIDVSTDGSSWTTLISFEAGSYSGTTINRLEQLTNYEGQEIYIRCRTNVTWQGSYVRVWNVNTCSILG